MTVTFKQFLNEVTLDLSDTQSVAKRIYQECAEFLRATKFGTSDQTPFYRGLNISKGLVQRLDAVKNREPTDSPLWLQRVIDDHLEEQFGYRFRENGTFAISNRVTASSYGVIYQIFPVGKLNFCYSKVIDDAYTFFYNAKGESPPAGLDEMEQILRTQLDDKMAVDEPSEWKQHVENYLRIAKPYTNTKLDDAGYRNLNSHNHPEVTFLCDHYYAICVSRTETTPEDRFKTEEVLDELKKLCAGR